MRLREALELIQQGRPAGAERERYLLACSSTPVHLQAFLRAYLLKARPDRDLQVGTSAYGDLLGSLERLSPVDCAGVAVVCEWCDLDPRLGFRRLGGWAPSGFEDILADVHASFGRLKSAIEHIVASVPVAISLPTLPLPPLEISTPAQALTIEPRLEAAVWGFAEWCAQHRGVRLVSRAEVDYRSPLSGRFDLRSEIGQGCPYSLAHTAVLAELTSRLLAPATPLKGLITDLDDTLWDGILGEAGVSGVRFTLDAGAQIHGLYQQLLQSFADRGVLVAVASKNEPALVEQALARADLLVRRDSLFPVDAHWGAKSESIGRILKAWNVGADAVAFVDDSPLELAEVQARFPEVRCLRFPKREPGALLDFFRTLREWFGRTAIRDEDRIRARSLQSPSAVDLAPADPAAGEAFLAGLQAHLSFRLSQDTSDERALELINKTNQFNLNGRRITESNWRETLGRPGMFLVTVAYTDRFGPLGKIAAVVGNQQGGCVTLSWWVMSCRAFSRRIEHATLRYLFERFGASRILLDFEPTERNGPLREFLTSLEIPVSAPEISRTEFLALCPHLAHSSEEPTHV